MTVHLSRFYRFRLSNDTVKIIMYWPQKHRGLWKNQSQFIRSAVHWLDRSIREGTFKVQDLDKEVVR